MDLDGVGEGIARILGKLHPDAGHLGPYDAWAVQHESQAVLGAALYCGCDDGGKSLPPGTYYAVLQGGGAPLRCTFTVLP